MENQDFEFVAITRNKKAKAVTEAVTIEKAEESVAELGTEAVAEQSAEAVIAQDVEAVASQSVEEVTAQDVETPTAQGMEVYIEKRIEAVVEQNEEAPAEKSSNEQEYELTFAPIEKLTPPIIEKTEKKEDEIIDDDFIKESANIDWKKVINGVCNGLLVLLLAIPLLLLIYIIVTYIK